MYTREQLEEIWNDPTKPYGWFKTHVKKIKKYNTKDLRNYKIVVKVMQSEPVEKFEYIIKAPNINAAHALSQNYTDKSREQMEQKNLSSKFNFVTSVLPMGQ